MSGYATPVQCPQRRIANRHSWSSGCLVMGLVVALGGCSVTPWVKPYERERLSDPMMKFSRDAMAEKHIEHVRDVREGARGATGVQGGGCGCN